jgi:hypothetical protein
MDRRSLLSMLGLAPVAAVSEPKKEKTECDHLWFVAIARYPRGCQERCIRCGVWKEELT